MYDHVWLWTCSFVRVPKQQWSVAPFLLKFELFIPSSAITYLSYITRLDFFMLIGRKMRIASADSSSYIENKPHLIDFINHKVFSICRQTPDYPPIGSPLSADWSNYNMALASVSMRVLHIVAKLTVCV